MPLYLIHFIIFFLLQSIQCPVGKTEYFVRRRLLRHNLFYDCAAATESHFGHITSLNAHTVHTKANAGPNHESLTCKDGLAVGRVHEGFEALTLERV